MTSLIPFGITLFAIGSSVTSCALHLVHRYWRAWLSETSPRVRVRWVVALLAMPLLGGLGLVLLTAGPCLRTLLSGSADECMTHGGPGFYFCLLHPPKVTAWNWVVAALCLAKPSFRVAQVAWSIGSSSRLLRHLKSTATLEPDQRATVWCLPGAMSFVAGWPRPAIYLGAELKQSLSATNLRAVLAHEAAHLRRFDIHLKLGMRLLASLHLAPLRAELLDELELATEQACDAEAAAVLSDPLLVADALVEVARLQSVPSPFTAAAFAGTALSLRVEALCSPHWRTTRGLSTVLVLCIVSGTATAVTYDQYIHNAVETVMQLLSK